MNLCGDQNCIFGPPAPGTGTHTGCSCLTEISDDDKRLRMIAAIKGNREVIAAAKRALHEMLKPDFDAAAAQRMSLLELIQLAIERLDAADKPPLRKGAK